MTLKQLREWMVYEELEPFGNDREEYLIGSVIQLLANVHRGKERKHRPYSLDDSTPNFGDRPRMKKGTSDWRAIKEATREMTEEQRQSSTRRK